MNVLVIKNEYLPYSESFVFHELANFSRYRPILWINKLSPSSYFPIPCPYIIENWKNSKVIDKRLSEICNTYNISIIYFEFGNDAYEFINKCKERRFSTPIIVSLRGADVSLYVDQRHVNYKLINPFVSLFLVRSKEMRERVEKLGIQNEKLLVHHSGISLEMFKILGKPSKHNFKVINCSRLVEKKGIDDLIIGIKHLVDSGIKILLDIYGDGPLKPRYIEKVHDLGLSKTISINEPIMHTEMPFLLGEYDVLIQTSKKGQNGDMEGIPVILMEAMAMGMKIIATDHAGITELLVEKEWAEIVPEGNPSQIANALKKTICGNPLSKAVKDKRVEFIRENFNAGKQSQKLELLFDKFIDK